MTIYVIEKFSEYMYAATDDAACDTEIIESVGAFDNFDDAFNTIFSCVKNDVDDLLEYAMGRGCLNASASEPEVDANNDVYVSVDYGNDDSAEITYRVVPLEFHRREV